MTPPRKIAVATGTRAEYGLLYHTLNRLRQTPGVELQLLVTGTHLDSRFGLTITKIELDRFTIARSIPLYQADGSPAAVAGAMAEGLKGFAKAYADLQPDLLLVLGDRYEILAAVTAAVPFNIPIAHISGGESTEGAMDEQIRHAITKMAHLHFPGADLYAENLRRMGEEAWRVFNAGDPGIENLRLLDFMSREETLANVKFSGTRPLVLGTLHPTTLNSAAQEERDSAAFFAALDAFPDVDFVLTYPNSDNHGDIIIRHLEAQAGRPNRFITPSLGNHLYLSVMRQAAAVIGNSSSALVEAPYLKIPVVNYGDRQMGRLKADNILDVPADTQALVCALRKCLDDAEFKAQVQQTASLYGDGDTSAQICRVITTIPLDDKLLRKRLSLSR